MTVPAASHDARPSRTFTPPCGPVVGRIDGPVVRVSGIPYAGAARFEAPRPVPDWTVARSCMTPAPACPQPRSAFLDEMIGSSFGDLPLDEDCQRLTITMPADTGVDDTLPVMVFIHGGSHVSGAGDMAVGDPAMLVAEQRVIVVAVTFRLGLLGFLGDGETRPANLGLLDQIAALEWVQRNIAAFGGDPRCVTIFGESAGADAIHAIMATAGAERLFRRAILQSAPFGIARRRGAMYAAMMAVARHITSDMPVGQVTDMQPLVAKEAAAFGSRGMMPFGPHYGIAPLPSEEAADRARAAVAPHIDVLVGHTTEEARFFLAKLPAIGRMTRWPLLGPVIRRGVVALFTFMHYSRGAGRFARLCRQGGGRTYLYALHWAARGGRFGACHAIDLPLLFGTEATWRGAAMIDGIRWSEIEAPRRALQSLWARFARGEDLGERGSIPDVLRYRRP